LCGQVVCLIGIMCEWKDLHIAFGKESYRVA